MSRRRFLIHSGVVAAIPLGAAAAAAPVAPPAHPTKVLVIGAHPGDPEAGCGGTMARYADAGHVVVALYLTRGEAGVAGRTHEQAAAIRTAEAEAACRVLKARPAYVGQLDGATEVNAARAEAFAKVVAAESPDVVFTHWPLDTHADHRACASLTYDAWLRSRRAFALYFYEVDLGSDTQCFRPTHYVDVTATEPRKREACMAHASQNPAGPRGFYDKDHVPMLRFRGMESGCKSAEAFIHHDQSPRGLLPE